MTTAPRPLVLKRVTHRYGRSGPDTLKNISIGFNSGEFVAIVGPNGSGKTTLAKHFNGLLRPASGSIQVEGVDAADLTVAQLSRKVGFVFQNPDRQIFSYTVWDEVAFGLRLRGRPEEDVEKRTQMALERVGIWEARDRHPGELSGGQRQRLATATVLALETPILVLDEPTTGQDYAARRQLMSLAQDLHDAGSTIIAITHDMALVAEYAQRVLLMVDGSLCFDGSPNELFSDESLLSRGNLREPEAVRLGRMLGFDSVQSFPPTLPILAQHVVQLLSKHGSRSLQHRDGRTSDGFS